MNPPDTLLVRAVDELGTAEPWSGTVWRHTAPGRSALSGAGSRIYGGRWNPPETVSTIYLASTESGCRKELGRLLTAQARGGVSFPRTLHRIEAHDIVAVDLTAPGALNFVGLTWEDLVDDDWTACQIVGNAVQYMGIMALRAPSATHDGDVVAVYEPHIRAGQLEVTDSAAIPYPT